MTALRKDRRPIVVVITLLICKYYLAAAIRGHSERTAWSTPVPINSTHRIYTFIQKIWCHVVPLHQNTICAKGTYVPGTRRRVLLMYQYQVNT